MGQHLSSEIRQIACVNDCTCQPGCDQAETITIEREYRPKDASVSESAVFMPYVPEMEKELLQRSVDESLNEDENVMRVRGISKQMEATDDGMSHFLENVVMATPEQVNNAIMFVKEEGVKSTEELLDRCLEEAFTEALRLSVDQSRVATAFWKKTRASFERYRYASVAAAGSSRSSVSEPMEDADGEPSTVPIPPRGTDEQDADGGPSTVPVPPLGANEQVGESAASVTEQKQQQVHRNGIKDDVSGSWEAGSTNATQSPSQEDQKTGEQEDQKDGEKEEDAWHQACAQQWAKDKAEAEKARSKKREQRFADELQNRGVRGRGEIMRRRKELEEKRKQKMTKEGGGYVGPRDRVRKQDG